LQRYIPLFPDQNYLNLEVFVEGRKAENPEKNPESKTRTNNKLRACLQGGRVTLASGLTLAGGQKIALVY